MAKLHSTPSLDAALPWLVLCRPNLIMNKDGSLLACYKYKGVDRDFPFAERFDQSLNALEGVLSKLDGEYTTWARVRHRRKPLVIAGKYDNPIEAKVHDAYAKHVGASPQFNDDFNYAILNTPATGADKFFSNIRFHIDQGGLSPIVAFWNAAKDSFLQRKAFVYSSLKTSQHAKRFNDALASLEGGLLPLSPRRLEMEELLEVLHNAANPTVERPVRWTTNLLDTHLSESAMTYGSNYGITESAHGAKCFMVLTVKDWEPFTKDGMIEDLLDEDCDFDISLMFRHLDSNQAKAVADKAKRFHKLASIDLLSALLKTKTNDTDQGSLKLSEQADMVKTRITSESAKYGFLNISIVCYGNSINEVEDAAGRVVRVLSRSGIAVLVEGRNLEAAWHSTLPGAWHHQKRLQFMEIPNLSCLVPTKCVSSGRPENQWYRQEQVADYSPLAVMPTRYRTPFQINFHNQAGNGHLFVIGPAGNGKSVMLNFWLLLAGKYKPRRYRFDKDRSCRIPTLLTGGRFIDITGKFASATKINPIRRLIGDPRHHSFLAIWLEQLAISIGDFTITPDMKKDIWESLKRMAQGTDPAYYRMKYFVVELSDTRLRDQLEPWMEGREFGEFFDNEEDGFDLSDNLDIEMGSLINNHPLAATAFMEYAFYLITEGLSEKEQRPTIIEIEECWFFLNDKRFAKRLEEWLVTIRKRNGSLWMATQSLAQIKGSGIADILRENVKNFVLLPNPSATQELYSEFLSLTADQLKAVREAVPFKDYYLLSEVDGARMLDGRLPPEIVAMTTSSENAQKTFDRHLLSGNSNWKDAYIEEMTLNLRS